MKLIELLVKELPKRGGWPEGAESVVQDADDTEFYFFTGGPVKNSGRSWWFAGDDSREDNSHWIFFEGKNDVADDCNSSIITRSQYESALAASEGWIEWEGGECPVDGAEIVHVKFRTGSEDPGVAGVWHWEHDGSHTGIIAYRLHKPDINSHANDDRLEQDLNDCIGQDVVNHQSHYTKGNIECIDAIDSATAGKSGIEAVCVANVIKYLWRYEEKGGLESVRKAQWYLNKLISELESN